MPELDKPDDPDEVRTYTTIVRAADLMPLVDTSGGVQLADREGVFAHSFRCRRCTLHFVLFSWSATQHAPVTIVCPECGGSGGFLHRTTVLSESRGFSLARDRAPEIHDVWPFGLAGDAIQRRFVARHDRPRTIPSHTRNWTS